MHTMLATRRPVLQDAAADFLRVLAVAKDAGSPTADEVVCIEPGTGKWSPCKGCGGKRMVGTPAIITLDKSSAAYSHTQWRGNLVLFGVHFSEIQRIEGLREDVLADMIEQVDGAEEVARFRAATSRLDAPAKQLLMQGYARRYVASPPQTSKRYTSTSLSSASTG